MTAAQAERERFRVRREKLEAVDNAIDSVLQDLHDRRMLNIRSNPASNLRDALVAGLNERGFDVASEDDIDD